MNEEIEIEEHNLLESPVVKNLFPDLCVLKHEIIQHCEDYYAQPESKYYLQTSNDYKYNIKVESNGSEDEDAYLSDVKVLDYNETTLEYVDSCPSTSQSKFILGSKTEIPKCTLDDLQAKLMTMKIVIKDVQPYLVTSKRFCNNCLILFPDNSNMDRHKLKYHNIELGHGSNKLKGHKQDENFLNNKSIQDVLRKDEVEIKDYKTSMKEVDIKIKKVYQCKICQKFTPNSYALTEHENEHKIKGKSNIISVDQHENEPKLHEKIDDDLSSHIVEDLLSSDEPLTKQLIVDVKNEDRKIRKIYQCKLCHKFHSSKQVFENHECIVKDKCKDDTSKRHLRGSRKRTNTVISNVANTNNNKKVGKVFHQCRKCPMVCRNSYIRDLHEKVHEKQKEVTFYKCDVCYLRFPNFKSMKRHRNYLHQNIKRQSKSVILEKIITDQKQFPCNICKAVFKFSQTLKRHNCNNVSSNNENNCETRQEQNKEQVNIFENIPQTSSKINQHHNQVLKSVLYKCQKCDIHFMFAKTAANHEQHMDMLVNWKCHTCSRIFKIQDKQLHLVQHNNDEKDIQVLNLTSAELIKVLYNCPKCAVHFAEDEFLNHYNSCGIGVIKSCYCRICDILVAQNSMLDHESNHKEGLASDSTIVITEVINATEPNKSTNRVSVLKMYYCKDCKSYFSKSKIHSNVSCLNIKKNICKLCGLPIPTEDMPNHGKIHTVYGNFKISHFMFLDIKTGNQITPPVPSFPRCHSCQVHFTSKAAIKRHICGDKVSTHCAKCDKKFTFVALRLHVPFHSLSNSDNITKLNATVKPVQSLSYSDNKSKLNVTVKAAHNISDSDNKTELNSAVKSGYYLSNSDNKTIENSIVNAVNNLSNSVNKTKLNSTVTAVEIVDETKEPSLKRIRLNQALTDPSIIKEISKKEAIIYIPRLKLPLHNHTKIIAPKKSRRIIFSCKSCELAFDAYDKVVEHCQKHNTNKEKEFSGENCKLCGLTFETRCSYEHSNLLNDYVKVEFDLDFFLQDNSVWTLHVFGSIASEKGSLLNNSIYKSDARIKMTIVQKGSSSVTIYQCDKCGCCVSKDLYNHMKNACFNIRKHLCNTCGLAFVSYIAKENHEYIHRTADIGIKDYRIVKFNREEDREYHTSVLSALNKKYILNQCRNCNGIVNIAKFKQHICKPTDLRKCNLCGLLIYKKDINIHNEKHNSCKKYTQENMKILLCGQIDESSQNMLLKPTFTGFVCDYTFYKCAKCHGVGDFQCSNHVCNDFKIKCEICDQLFLSRFHKKLHKQDTDFTKANINIIEFNLKKIDVHGNSPINTNSLDSEDVSAIVIYKCPICSLHFLNKQNTFSHLKSCNPKSKLSKQTCSKCGLTFTSNTLFNHLVKHHGNGNKHWIFTIIDVDKINTMFKCSHCILYFTTYCEAFEHSIQCYGSAVGEKCTDCDLIVSPSCYQIHKRTHLKKYKLTNLMTVPVVSRKAIEEMTNNFNDALNKRLELAKDSLSKLNFSTFSNVLYHCEVCNVYFIDLISIYLHFLSDAHDSVINEMRDNCKICSFEFLLSDLTSHVFVHHKKWGLARKHFVILDSQDLFKKDYIS